MFQSLESLGADPILGLMAAYRADSHPQKIDLGIGVYKDAQGRTPIMAAVKEAEKQILASQVTKAYVGPEGDPRYNDLVANLLLGNETVESLKGRRCTVQTPGGCGGLRLAAEFIKKARPDARIWVSDPTWPNHVPLLGAAGLKIESYPYYNHQEHVICFDRMMDALQEANSNDLVLLHGCCHNPCGADLSNEQWRQLKDLALKNGFTVFIDLAYQGLGDGLIEDVYGVRLMAQSLPELIVVSSCSKNFGLYRERTGALTVMCESPDALPAIESQVAAIARGIYSMPPDHGAAIVQLILSTPELKSSWDHELTEMRDRINGLRSLFVSRMKQAGIEQDLNFIQREKGMFSFLGISVEQVATLVRDYSIYLVNSSRINVAGINENNIDYLIDALGKVLESR